MTAFRATTLLLALTGASAFQLAALRPLPPCRNGQPLKSPNLQLARLVEQPTMIIKDDQEDGGMGNFVFIVGAVFGSTALFVMLGMLATMPPSGCGPECL